MKYRWHYWPNNLLPPVHENNLCSTLSESGKKEVMSKTVRRNRLRSIYIQVQLLFFWLTLGKKSFSFHCYWISLALVTVLIRKLGPAATVTMSLPYKSSNFCLLLSLRLWIVGHHRYTYAQSFVLLYSINYDR